MPPLEKSARQKAEAEFCSSAAQMMGIPLDEAPSSQLSFCMLADVQILEWFQMLPGGSQEEADVIKPAEEGTLA